MVSSALSGVEYSMRNWPPSSGPSTTTPGRSPNHTVVPTPMSMPVTIRVLRRFVCADRRTQEATRVDK